MEALQPTAVLAGREEQLQSLVELPLTGEDDTFDFDAASLGLVTTRLPPLQMAQPDLPAGYGEGDVAPPESRNAPCPCGSGRKYKHCHGVMA